VNPAGALKAFTLIRFVRPNISLVQWMDMVANCHPASDGLTAWIEIEDSRICLHALFPCNVVYSGILGNILRVSEFFIAELPGSNATSAVVDCAAHLAAQDQAKTLEFNLVDQQMGLILLRLGHQLQSNGWALELRKIMRFRPIRH